MAAPGGLPLAAIVRQPQAALLAQQHLAAGRGPMVMTAGGQQLRGGAAAPAAALAAAAAADNARRLAGKKRKPMEQAAAEKALHLIPECPLFNSLVLQEHHVDELIKRRRLEIQAAMQPLECAVHKRLRVYIYSTHSHQPPATQPPGQQQGAAGSLTAGEEGQQQQQDGGGGNGGSTSAAGAQEEPPQWTLCLWGRLIDPEPPAAPAAAGAGPGGTAAAGEGAAGTSADAAGASTAAATAPAAAGAAAAAAAAAAPGGAAPAAGAAAAPAAAGDASLPSASSLPPQPNQQALQQAVTTKYPFTGFFSHVDIQLDPEQYPGEEGHLVWDKLMHRGQHKDRFEVKRTGSRPVQVTIKFEQEFVPPAYKLDPRLAEVLGMTFGQHQAVLTRLYCYITSRTPQPDVTQLKLDDKLASIFGAQQLPAASLPQALGKLLQPLEPAVVSHTIDPQGPSPGPVTCVDFDVLLPTKLQDKISAPIDQLLDDKQSEALEQRLCANLAKLYESRRRRMMYLGFAEDPVAFLNVIIASQARELRVGRSGRVEVERRTEAFRDKWVDEATARYLGRKNKQDVLFPALNALQPM